MADWLKVMKDTPDKPEIAILARRLGVSQADAFLEWFRVFTWADGITDDGSVPFLSRADGDTLSRCRPGTCEILSGPDIRWIEPIDGDWANGFLFAKWDRHNGKCAKARSLDAEKKRKQRESSRKCPDARGTKPGLEKRREEKNIDSPKGESPHSPPKPARKRRQTADAADVEVPSQLRTPEFLASWADWLEHRRAIKKPLPVTSAKAQLSQFCDWGIPRAIAAMRHTIRKGWQGLREPDAADARRADDPRGTMAAIDGYLALKERTQ